MSSSKNSPEATTETPQGEATPSPEAVGAADVESAGEHGLVVSPPAPRPASPSTDPAYFPSVGTAAEFMSTAPKALNGSSPWASRYASDIKRVFAEHAARAPRTLQQHLGPSELGVECDRQVAGKLAAIPATNHVVDFWPSLRGTYCHAGAAEAFDADNLRTGLLRWVTEKRVTPHPEHPGTADLYDAVEQVVDDHKFLGDSSMAKIRKGWLRHYKVQLFLYGLGYLLMGLPVRKVVLLAYPVTAGSLDGMYVRDADFTSDGYTLLPEVVDLLKEAFDDTDRRKAYAAQITAGQIGFMDVPSAPDTDGCYFCPFFRPQSAKDSGPGCPGTASTTPFAA